MVKNDSKLLSDNLKETMTVSASKEKQALIKKFLKAKKLSFENISQLLFYLLDQSGKAVSLIKDTEMVIDKKVYDELTGKADQLDIANKAIGDYKETLDTVRSNINNVRSELVISQTELNKALISRDELQKKLDEALAVEIGVTPHTMMNFSLVKDFVVNRIRKEKKDETFEMSDADLVAAMLVDYAKDIKALQSANNTKA